MRSGSSSSSSRFKIRPKQGNASTCDSDRCCLQSGDNTGTTLIRFEESYMSTKATAARIYEYGEPDVFRFETMDVPDPVGHDTEQSREKIMNQTLQDVIEHRRTTNVFEPNHTISDEQIKHLVNLAPRAPTSFNLQNWRFLAVRTPEGKAKLRKLAYDQAKVSEAAVTFIVCGQLADYSVLEGRLAPSVAAGFMSHAFVAGWVG